MSEEISAPAEVRDSSVDNLSSKLCGTYLGKECGQCIETERTFVSHSKFAHDPLPHLFVDSGVATAGAPLFVSLISGETLTIDNLAGDATAAEVRSCLMRLRPLALGNGYALLLPEGKELTSVDLVPRDVPLTAVARSEAWWASMLAADYSLCLRHHPTGVCIEFIRSNGWFRAARGDVSEAIWEKQAASPQELALVSKQTCDELAQESKSSLFCEGEEFRWGSWRFSLKSGNIEVFHDQPGDGLVGHRFTLTPNSIVPGLCERQASCLQALLKMSCTVPTSAMEGHF